MKPAEFKTKWAKFSGKESAAYQSHFDDLCRLLKVQPPLLADPSGETFCFQKKVVKDAELFDTRKTASSAPHERGFADVWKNGCFAWEYKTKHKDLDIAYKQLLRYREGLLNPPLLVVCDFDRYIIKTNFNGTVQEKYEFTNAEIDRPENLRILRALFECPNDLKPKHTTAEVTETLAGKIAEVALSLQKRESVEIADAATRKKVSFAQRKNLRIARFLNRIIFCFFAEDSKLLPEGLFSEIVKTSTEDAKQFACACENLFRVMSKGGMFGHHKVRHFNGHLFEEATVFELNETELGILVEAAAADWQFIQPSIMGTLFERALDENQRAQLGAHYTSEQDILTLVEPVLMSPLREEWSGIRGELAASLKRGKATQEQQKKVGAFLKKLSSLVVLDPACGSGNFLYVSLQLLLDLEKEVITLGTQLGMNLNPKVSVRQLRAIEVNPYAYELAQVSVQIGFLQWRRENGFDNDRTPILQVLDGFENKDALMNETFKKKSRRLRAAREEEHHGQESLFKIYIERTWPDCDVIIGNPPFVGGSRIWRQLGRGYQTELWRVYKDRVPGAADLCCYWFEKARQQIETKKCKRAGLLATQAIRGGANREVLKRIKETGDIFFAESDRDWILDGAAVHVSMIGFDDGSTKDRLLDGKPVEIIHANLTSLSDTTTSKTLTVNLKICFIGTKKAGKFEIAESQAITWLRSPNTHGKPNSDVLRPWVNGNSLVTVRQQKWIVDAGVSMPLAEMAGYEKPFSHVVKFVKPDRDKNNEPRTKENYWIHKRPGPDLRAALSHLTRCVAVVRHSKHLIFSWLNTAVLPDDGIQIFARTDDLFFGIVASRVHAAWAFAQGTQVREKESGFRYTPQTCFEMFPFPRATPRQEAAISAAAKDLDDLRERWLNPPEWSMIEMLEFPGSLGGPWQRYLDKKTIDQNTGIGTVRYPRLSPRDAGCAAKLKERTLTKLYNEGPAWLGLAHKRLDDAVAAAYGFPADLSDSGIVEKLLAINLSRAAEQDE